MTDFAALLGGLLDAGVEFVVIGGVAAVAHGAARATYDLTSIWSIAARPRTSPGGSARSGTSVPCSAA